MGAAAAAGGERDPRRPASRPRFCPLERRRLRLTAARPVRADREGNKRTPSARFALSPPPGRAAPSPRSPDWAVHLPAGNPRERCLARSRLLSPIGRLPAPTRHRAPTRPAPPGPRTERSPRAAPHRRAPPHSRPRATHRCAPPGGAAPRQRAAPRPGALRRPAGPARGRSGGAAPAEGRRGARRRRAHGSGSALTCSGAPGAAATPPAPPTAVGRLRCAPSRPVPAGGGSGGAPAFDRPLFFFFKASVLLKWNF